MFLTRSYPNETQRLVSELNCSSVVALINSYCDYLDPSAIHQKVPVHSPKIYLLHDVKWICGEVWKEKTQGDNIPQESDSDDSESKFDGLAGGLEDEGWLGGDTLNLLTLLSPTAHRPPES